MSIRDQIIEKLARAYDIEPDEDGTYNLNTYDWISGCSTSAKDEYGEYRWITLANIVNILDDGDWDFDDDYDDDDYE